MLEAEVLKRLEAVTTRQDESFKLLGSIDKSLTALNEQHKATVADVSRLGQEAKDRAVEIVKLSNKQTYWAGGIGAVCALGFVVFGVVQWGVSTYQTAQRETAQAAAIKVDSIATRQQDFDIRIRVLEDKNGILGRRQ